METENSRAGTGVCTLSNLFLPEQEPCLMPMLYHTKTHKSIQYFEQQKLDLTPRE